MDLPRASAYLLSPDTGGCAGEGEGDGAGEGGGEGEGAGLGLGDDPPNDAVHDGIVPEIKSNLTVRASI